MHSLRLKVAVVGAGLGGLAAAIGIAKAGHQVIVIEQASALSEIGAGIQVPPNSTRILDQWGLLEKLKRVSMTPTAWIVRSYRNGETLSSLELESKMEEVYGFPFLQVHRADYLEILIDEARRLGVDFQINSNVTGIDFDKPAVLIKDQPDIVVDFAVGADGLKSVCRECLLGHPDPPRLSGDLAYRIVVKCKDINPKFKSLIERPTINYWMGPDAHAVSYQIRDGELLNMVITRPDNLPQFVNVEAANIEEMREFFRKWDPAFQSLLEIVQETSKWRLQTVPEMKQWSSPSRKFVLVGDACHATLPYLAQGAAQAVEDGAVLGRLFEKLTNKEQIGAVVELFESLRKPRSSAVVKTSNAFQTICHLQDGPLQEERDRRLLEEEPAEGYPHRLADPVFQKFLFDYDVVKVVDHAWEKYLIQSDYTAEKV